MDTGRAPDKPKVAKVIHVFKADDNNIFSNYRPIGYQFSQSSKILERVVCTRLVKYFSKRNIFSEKITLHLCRC